MYFALHSGYEHRQLHHSPCQIQLIEKPSERPYLLYTEDRSKNNPAGLKGRQYKPKVVPHYGNIKNPNRCFVQIFKKYTALCPPGHPNNTLYLTPLTPSETCWFSCVPLGWNKLSNAVASMCRQAESRGIRLTIFYEQQRQLACILLVLISSLLWSAQAIATLKELGHKAYVQSAAWICVRHIEQLCKEALYRHTMPHAGLPAMITAPSTAGTTICNVSIPTQLQTSSTDHAGAFYQAQFLL